MFLRIESLAQKKIVGKHLKMSLANNKTFELWQSFRQRQKEIKNTVGSDLYSIQVYSSAFNPNAFTPHTEFEKWAAIEVADFDDVPEGFETYTLKGGLYAVFIHKGTPQTFSNTWQYIFYQWLPQSGYQLDDREHFELLGEKYRHNHPESEEEVWIPVKPKQ
jgi:AraC family transcriptional regulator